MAGQSLLVPFRRLEKGLAVKAKPIEAVTAETDMYPNPQSPIPVHSDHLLSKETTNPPSVAHPKQLAHFLQVPHISP